MGQIQLSFNKKCPIKSLYGTNSAPIQQKLSNRHGSMGQY